MKPCIDGKKPDEAVFHMVGWFAGEGFPRDLEKTHGESWRPEPTLHDLRRSAARNLLRAGVDRDAAKRIAGPKTDSMFGRCNIVAESDLAEAAGKLDSRRNDRKLVTDDPQYL